MELELKGITKRFPGVLANDRVNLSIRSGEVLGLLGENGAGKTTLMNILYGLYSATEGEILIDGKVQDFQSPGHAIAAGIGMVHQHFMLVPVFTVAENVVLGVEPTKIAGILNMEEARSDVREISAKYGLEVDPDAVIEDLPVGIQQRVEIIKVLFRQAEVIVFDEPTAVLTPQEVEEFFGIVRSLRDAGKGIVFITHKLDEIREVADRINVLRRGRIVGEADPKVVSKEQLAEMMVGRPVELVVAKGAANPGAPILEVEDLVVLDDRNHPNVDGVSFTVRSGEIVGIAGVQGNGQTELVEALTGLRSALSGVVRLAGNDVTDDTPRQIHRKKVAHVPEDRQRSGLVLSFTVAENLVLDSYYDEPFSKGIVMDWDVARKNAEKLVEEYDVRTPSIEVEARNLSGGNQQKVIVAREFFSRSRLHGGFSTDPGPRCRIDRIHPRANRQGTRRGRGGSIVSTELDEVMALSDRILVMYRGKIVAERRPDETNTTQLGLFMAGVAET